MTRKLGFEEFESGMNRSIGMLEDHLQNISVRDGELIDALKLSINCMEQMKIMNRAILGKEYYA